MKEEGLAEPSAHINDERKKKEEGGTTYRKQNLYSFRPLPDGGE